MPKPEQVVYDGLANVANAIRRSTAVYVAMNLLPPDSSMEELKEMTEVVAGIIRGTAGTTEGVAKPTPLGEPFPGAGGGYAEYSED